MNESTTKRINEFLEEIITSTEYLSIEYLVFSIRKTYLHYLSSYRRDAFKVPTHLNDFVNYLSNKFQMSNITPDEMLSFMLENDVNNWVHYYDYTFIRPYNLIKNQEKINCDGTLFMLVLSGFIFDYFKKTSIDIQEIVDNEKLIYETNQYGLSKVNGVEFKRDYFVYDNKAYLYSVLTNTSVIDFTDDMPGFAKIITTQINNGDILLRLDERLAVPVEHAISYSTLNFEKYYGPQFHFQDSNFENRKTAIVHIDTETCAKLLMVIKKDFDEIRQEDFLHIEIETLPYVDEKIKSKHCITTFLHGMYYPSDDCFTHIDYTINQYDTEDYIKKYTESDNNVPIDFYAKKELHYKIWCIENGKYSRKNWYNLMIVSLTPKYRKLLDEILV